MATSGHESSPQLIQLHNDLLRLSEKLRQYKKAESQKLFIAKRIDEEKVREKRLRKRLKKEKKDFDKMKGGTLKYIFHSILLNVESQREKEKQEWLAAQLQWEQCSAELLTLEKELQGAEDIFQSLKDAPAEYEDVFIAKEKILATFGLPPAILNTSEKIAAIKNQTKEIDEAVSVGKQLMQQLAWAADYFKSASGWGTWDLLGGGIITTAIKRGRMDQARDCMHNAQHLLNQYNKELSDIQSIQLEFKGGGFSAFADYFFDGLIVDWIVQSSINKAYNTVVDMYGKVMELNNRLLSKENDLAAELDAVQQQYKDLIESATI